MNEIRFNLDDIIKGNLVEEVFVSLSMIYNESPIQKLYFWHNGLEKDKIIKFQNRFEEVFEPSIKFLITEKSPETMFVWFDIINEEINKKFDCSNRFSYIYPINKKEKILSGILNFHHIYNYIETHPRNRRIIYDKNKDK